MHQVTIIIQVGLRYFGFDVEEELFDPRQHLERCARDRCSRHHGD